MVLINTSIGELVDKVTILQIKKIKISEPTKLKIVNNELLLLEKILSDLVIENEDEFQVLFEKLKNINLDLWEIEDKIRIFEGKKDFGQEFINLARSVYLTNDLRFQVKNNINLLLSSDIREVKSYEKY